MNIEENRIQAETDISKAQHDINSALDENLFIQLFKARSLSTEPIENSNQLTKLFQQDAQVYSLNRQEGKIIFTHPVYVQTISFITQREGKFELIVQDITGQLHAYNSKKAHEGESVEFQVNRVIHHLSLRFERLENVQFKSTEVSHFQVIGLNLSDLAKEIDHIKQIHDDRAEYESKINQHKKVLNLSIQQLNSAITNYEKVVQNKLNESQLLEKRTDDLFDKKIKLEESVKRLTEDQNKRELSIKSMQADKFRLKSSLDDDRRNMTLLKSELVQLEARKELLEKQVNMFPDTLEGFVNRTFKSKWMYFTLAIIPLALFGLICFIAWDTVSSFAQQPRMQNADQAWAQLVQWLPFTMLTIIFCSICIGFLYKIVNLLTETQQQELNLSKISMIARDISDSEFADLAETDKQNARLEYKMQLIRQFLSAEFARSAPNRATSQHGFFNNDWLGHIRQAKKQVQSKLVNSDAAKEKSAEHKLSRDKPTKSERTQHKVW